MDLIETITAFLASIGIRCRAGQVPDVTFLPGIVVEDGGLVFDPATLRYPGDLLHEAGHLAVMSPERRRKAGANVGKFAADEMMAIAWSYAAAVHLQIPLDVVFHPDGYRGGSASLIENFTEGRYLAVPMLQWLGMTLDSKHAMEAGVAPYPAMTKWLNDTDRPA